MSVALLFHGTHGHPNENWFPWLRSELEKRGYEVITPALPEPEAPTLVNWLPVLDDVKDKVGSDSIVIGHSLGAVMALRLLEQLDHPIHIAAFVGATLGIPPIKFIEGDNPFLEGGFRWEKIKQNGEHFIVFHSDNDPFVDIANGKELASKLGVEMSFVPDAGHFNESAGYTEFPDLLKKIQSMI